MSLLSGQADVNARTPMPVDRVDDASTVTAVSAETIVWSFVSSSAWAAAVGEAAGTLCTAKIDFTGILNSMNSAVGSKNDTSLTVGATTRIDTLVGVPDSVFSAMVSMTPTEQKAEMLKWLTTNGYYAVDHRRGQIWGLHKATVANDTVSYSYMAPVVGSSGPTANVNVGQFGGTAVTIGQQLAAASIPVILPSATISTLTPPAAITGFATETTLGSVKTAVETIDNAVSGAGFNITQLGGVNVSMNTGVRDTGTQRVTLATDDVLPLPTGASTLAEQQTQTASLSVLDDWDNAASDGASMSGDVAHNSADAGEPVKIGGKGITAPVAVTANYRTNAQFDIWGRQVVMDGGLREMKGTQITTITSSTAETTIVTADATYKLDLYGIIVVNTSATATEISVKDSTAGTTRFWISVPANDQRGFMLPMSAAHVQAAANNNWTATAADSVASVIITALFVKNL